MNGYNKEKDVRVFFNLCTSRFQTNFINILLAEDGADIGDESGKGVMIEHFCRDLFINFLTGIGLN